MDEVRRVVSLTPLIISFLGSMTCFYATFFIDKNVELTADSNCSLRKQVILKLVVLAELHGNLLLIFSAMSVLCSCTLIAYYGLWWRRIVARNFWKCYNIGSVICLILYVKTAYLLLSYDGGSLTEYTILSECPDISRRLKINLVLFGLTKIILLGSVLCDYPLQRGYFLFWQLAEIEGIGIAEMRLAQDDDDDSDVEEYEPVDDY